MIHSPEYVTPEEMTELLRQAGALTHGQVVKIERRATQSSPFGGSHQLFHLALRYANTGGEQPPERLFLKFGKSCKEWLFYTHIVPAMDACFLPRCYHASYHAETDQTCLMLEDLSASHWQSEWPLPPPVRQCEETVEALAEIHAGWWKDERLERIFRPALPKGRSWADRHALALEKLPGFLDFLGDRLSSNRRVIYLSLLASECPWELPPGAPGQTLLHGDMHFWNVLYPREPGNARPKFFDWNMWDLGRPTDDLAYLLALHWYPERRAWLERGLLERYHRRLSVCGISGYRWEQCWHDYRISVVRSLLIPVWQWVRGIHPGVWWAHLERGMLAYEDLGCRKLIGGA